MLVIDEIIISKLGLKRGHVGHLETCGGGLLVSVGEWVSKNGKYLALARLRRTARSLELRCGAFSSAGHS